MHRRLLVCATIALFPVVAKSSPIELGELVEIFMVKPGQSPSWTMGANDRRIKWETPGIALRKSTSERVGAARISFQGKEYTTLKRRVVPAVWGIVMSQDGLVKHGPQSIEIGPGCALAEHCPAETRKNLLATGFKLSRICKATDIGGSVATGYLASKNGKLAYIVDYEGVGSGGTMSVLTIYYKPKVEDRNLCDDTFYFGD